MIIVISIIEIITTKIVFDMSSIYVIRLLIFYYLLNIIYICLFTFFIFTLFNNFLIENHRKFHRKIKEIEEKKESGNAAFKGGSYQIAIDLWTESINLDTQNKSVTTKVNKNRNRK